MSLEAGPARPSAPPRYRGLGGALVYGLALAAVIALVGVVGGVVIWRLTGKTAPALQVVTRLTALGAMFGTAAALGRWLSGAASDRLLSVRFERGDLGAVGAIAGLVLAGCLADRGGRVIEIAGPTLDGGQFDLAEYRGKVVLVDFWATWCGPCIAELPNIHDVYNQYHRDGLEIVSVSLDQDRAALTKFLQSHPAPWPQIFFDEEGRRGWDNPIARQYGIDAIPRLMVIDRDGRLAADDVRGEEVGTAVARALGRPEPWGERLARYGAQVMAWLIRSVIELPLRLVFPCVLAGALAAVGLETAVRGLLRRPATPRPLAATDRPS